MTNDQTQKLKALIVWHDLKMKKCISEANFQTKHLGLVKASQYKDQYREQHLKTKVENLIKESNFHLESFRLLTILEDQLK